jgi:hypothetical protein
MMALFFAGDGFFVRGGTPALRVATSAAVRA